MQHPVTFLTLIPNTLQNTLSSKQSTTTTTTTNYYYYYYHHNTPEKAVATAVQVKYVNMKVPLM
jgi:hypothetical protein